MYIGYVDESGFVGKKSDPNQHLQAMACVLVNAYKLHKTNREFAKTIEIIRKHKIPLKELKAEEIYRGRGVWNAIAPDIRHRLIAYYLHWLKKRQPIIILSLIDNDTFFQLKQSSDQIANLLKYPYIAGVVQIASAIQKNNQPQKSNKGKSILVCDEQHIHFEDQCRNLLASPPTSIDGFYKFPYRKDSERLDQIIDTVYFVKSHHSYPIQIADTVAFISRLKGSFSAYNEREHYPGEKSIISKWFEIIKERLVSRSIAYPRDKTPICKFYRDIAPPSLPFN